MLVVWNALAIAFLVSVCNMLLQLARSSLLPLIVPRQELVTANAAHVTLTGAAMMLGNALVGPVVQHADLSGSFGVSCVTLLLSALLLLLLTVPGGTAPSATVARPGARDMLQGLSYVMRDRVVRTAFSLDALYFVLADGLVMTGIPLFVKDVLGRGPATYGYVQMAGNAGLLLGAMWLGQFGSLLPRGRVIVAGWLGYGLSLLILPTLRTLPAAIAGNFLASLCGNLIPTSGSSLLQERVPQALLGRVLGVWAIIAPGTGSISTLLAGALATDLPAAALIAAGATVCCANAVLGRLSALWHQTAEEAPGP